MICYSCGGEHDGKYKQCDGCRSIRLNKPKEVLYLEAFKRQKRRAEERGIDFLFSFEGWVAWWEDHLGPEWYKLRGIRSGQYVMSRFEDKGPYHPANVECTTVNDNHSQTPKNGTSGNRKLTDAQVVEIIDSVDKPRYLARRFGVDVSYIYKIRSGKMRQFLFKENKKG